MSFWKGSRFVHSQTDRSGPWYSEAGNPTMLAAVRKMLEHQARTGHKMMELLFLK